MLDGHIAGSEIDEAPGDKEGRHLARSTLFPEDRSFGNAVEAADSGADHRAGGTALFLCCRMPIGIVEGLARRSHRENDEVVDLALILRLHPLIRIEGAVRTVTARHLAGDLARQIS